MGEAKIGEQGQVALRFFHRVQVFPLEVLDESQLQDLPIVRFDDDRGDLFPARQFGGPPPPLPGDDLIVTGAQPPDREGLDHAVFLDGGGQIGQRSVIESFPGLVQAGFHLRYGQEDGA